MLVIFVTFAVFKFSMFEIVSNAVQFLKKSFNDVGAYVLKLSSKTIFLIVTFPKVVQISFTLLYWSTMTLLFTISDILASVTFLKVNVVFVSSYWAT